MNQVRKCQQCKADLLEGDFHKIEVVNQGEPNVILLGCPYCSNVVGARAVADKKEQVSLYLPTVDECTYTIHCLMKQEAKLRHALDQVHGTITKLEVLRELAKEKESI